MRQEKEHRGLRIGEKKEIFFLAMAGNKQKYQAWDRQTEECCY